MNSSRPDKQTVGFCADLSGGSLGPALSQGVSRVPLHEIPFM